jgi:hypothetical protein
VDVVHHVVHHEELKNIVEVDPHRANMMARAHLGPTSTALAVLK